MINYLKLCEAYRLDPTLPEHKIEIDKIIANKAVDDTNYGTRNAADMQEKYDAIEVENTARNKGISEAEAEQALADAANKKRIEQEKEAKLKAKEAAIAAAQEELSKVGEEEEKPKKKTAKKAKKAEEDVTPTPETDVE